MIHLLSKTDIEKLCNEPTMLKLKVKKNLKNYKHLNILNNGKITNIKTKKS